MDVSSFPKSDHPQSVISSTHPSMAAASTSKWTAPQWVNSFYAKFPLVMLEQEDVLDWRKAAAQSDSDAPYCLWVSTQPALARAR